MSAPAVISDMYSDVSMRVRLAATKEVSVPCAGEECALNKEFDRQIQIIGTRLSEVAFEAYPDLSKRIGHFEFVVAEKKEPGTTSNAAGTIVIFRGVQELYLEEQALAFVIAREMGHVVGRHHDKNTGASILFSVLATVLFPAVGILQGINSSAAAANTTSAATTAASSATSFVGSKMVLAGVKPKQLREADVIAMRLLEPLDWSGSDIANSLEASTHIDGEDAWAKDLRFSTAHVRTLVPEEVIATASAEPKVELPSFQVAQNAKPSKVATSLSEAELTEEKSEGQEVEIGNGASDILTEEPQLPDDVSHDIARNPIQPSTRGVLAKKTVMRADLNKKAVKTVPRKATKVVSKNANLKLTKATVGGKQGNSKKLYARRVPR